MDTIASTSQDQATIVAAGLGLVGLLLGYFAKYFLDKKRAFSSENAKIKREMYKVFLDKFIEASSQRISTMTPQQVEMLRLRFQEDVRNFYSTSVLFASPEVIKSYAAFERSVRGLQGARHEPSPHEWLFRKAALYKAMRRDIGLSNRGLGWDGEVLLQANRDDYDTTVRRYATWRVRIARWISR